MLPADPAARAGSTPEASGDSSSGTFAENIPLTMNLPTPWIAITETDAQKYEDEYAVEIEKGHPLYGVPVRAIARRGDTGDILFRLLRHLCDYASVSLTWSGEPESDITIPVIELYVDDAHLHGTKQPEEDDIEF